MTVIGTFRTRQARLATSVLEGILLQKSKIERPEKLAKVDLWTPPPLCRFSTPLWRSLVDFG
jgi:hypothetical protein